MRCVEVLICLRSVDLHISEASVDLVHDLVEVEAHLVLGSVRVFELHVQQFVHHVVFEGLLYEAHGNLAFGLRRVGDDAHAVVVELADCLHHAGCLYERAVKVVLREGILLKELFLDDLSRLSTKKCQV